MTAATAPHTARPVSVVVPVFNGMETLPRCLEALVRQRSVVIGRDYEIIVVDDGSTDGSGDWVRQHFPEIRVIRLERNRGRIHARLTGVHAARFEHLLLIDARVIASPDLLHTYRRLGQPTPCMAGDLGEEEARHPMERVFFCLRCAYYRPYPQSAQQPRLEITPANFHRAPKGTTAIFLRRQEYLAALPARFDRWTSDDTRLLRTLAARRPLLRDYRLKVTYLQRLRLRQVIPHLYQRGPLFADYYLGPGGPLRRWLPVAALLPGVLVSSALFAPKTTLAALAGTYSLLVLRLARRPGDLLPLAGLLPVLAASFGAGVAKGLLHGQRGGVPPA